MTVDQPSHLDSAAAEAYAERRVDPFVEVSIERHLVECARCRELIARAASAGTFADVRPERLQAVWSSVNAKIDESTSFQQPSRNNGATVFKRLSRWLTSLNKLSVPVPVPVRARLVIVMSAVAGLAAIGFAAVPREEDDPKPNFASADSIIQTRPADGAQSTDPITGVGNPWQLMSVENVAVFRIYLGSDPRSVDRAAAEVERLKRSGIEAHTSQMALIPETALPAFDFGNDSAAATTFEGNGSTVQGDFLVVYAGPFDKLSTATTLCSSQAAAFAEVCLPVQLPST